MVLELYNRSKVLLLITALVFAFVIAMPQGSPEAQTGPAVTAAYSTSIGTWGDPVRVAVDAAGAIYVAVPLYKQVFIFGQDGTYTRALTGFDQPLSVAVDAQSRVYVGDYANGSVSVVDSTGAYLFSLGKGHGEFGMPGDIAIAQNGQVYVTDSQNHVVKVYGQNGAFLFSFGGLGANPGQMSFPSGIAYDATAQEIYVVDHDNGRVEVFDLNGVFKRTFSRLGAGQGKLGRPQGIAVSGGFVYVADAYQSSVQIFDTNGVFVTFIGQFGTGDGGLKVPMDVSVAGTTLFVADSDNKRIAAYNITTAAGGGGLAVSPTVLSFSTEAGVIPAGQTIQVDPAVAGTQTSWTAVTAAPFVLSAASGTAPATVTVGVNMTGLQPGAYNGTVTFTAQNGTTSLVSLSLTVTQPSVPPPSGEVLAVSPGNVSMSYRKGDAAVTASVSVTSSGSPLSWTASADPALLSIAPASGTTPGGLTISLTDPVNIAEGSYNTTVAVSGSGSSGTAVVAVSLTVIVAGSIEVKTNLDGATFTVTGPATYNGTGRLWRTDMAKEGQYTIEFAAVPGYTAPDPRTVQVVSGNLSAVDVQYTPEKVANVIAAGKGSSSVNNGLVKVVDLNGVAVSEFMGVTTMYGANVAMGDVDGDGFDEIIVTPGHDMSNPALVNVFRSNGTLVASSGPVANTKGGAHAATGDIDGDGKSEIALGMRDAVTGGGYSVILYSVDQGALMERATISVPSTVATNAYPAEVAFGDVDGDGRAELIVVRENIVSVYAFDGAFLPSLVGSVTVAEAVNPWNRTQVSVSAGDLNGDGTSEIVVGYYSGGLAVVKVLNGNLSNFGLSFSVFPSDVSSPSLSVMNADGDAASEILAGKGNYYRNYGTVRIFKANGTLVKEITPFPSSAFGVSAAFGYIQR